MYVLKKSLGQHFLRDENICKKIVAAIMQDEPKQLLEVGPGGGAITRFLFQQPSIAFKAIELDDEKVDYLEKTYPELKGRIIQQNFLDAEPPFEGAFAVAGNFPYNISTQIVFKILDWRTQVPVATGMFQKEVAQRIAAPPGNKTYGVMSVLTQAYYDVKYLFDVHEQCFDPPPKVKSGVIKLYRKNTTPSMRSDADFFKLVKMAFNQRRKTLRNAVKPLFEETVLQEAVFGNRAEQLSVADFAQLTFKMKS
ncbi:MAG: 16S rRNA (adenine(1518)-N(6)/adenine(1519)-N(6))-dimethyltransferase RsmA [Niabella sp.]